MIDWAKIVASGDLPTILVLIVIAVVVGGGAVALINGWYASKRGVKGDALIKEQNGITGLTNLSEQQGEFITTMRDEIAGLKKDMGELRKELHTEIAYSNGLINLLSRNNIPIPPRK